VRLRLVAKLCAAFIAVSLIVSLVGLQVSYSLRTVAAAYQDVVVALQPATTHLARIIAAFEAQNTASRTYLLYGDSTSVGLFNQASGTISQELLALKDSLDNEAYKEAIASIEKLKQEYETQFSASLDLAEEGKPADALSALQQTIPLTQESARIAEELSKQIERDVTAAVQAAQNSTKRAEIFGYAATAAALVAAWALGLLLARQIARPVQQTAALARRVAAGDLSVEEVQLRSTDEVGEMAAAINKMMTELRRVLQAVVDNSGAVMTAAQQLSGAADQSASAAQAAAESIARVASGSQEQAQSAQVVRQNTADLDQAIRQVAAGAAATAENVQRSTVVLNSAIQDVAAMAAGASRVAQEADAAVRTARDGAAVVDRTLEAVGRIREAAGQIAERINALGGLSRQIGEITNVISDIADQTNLLALNAAIEAARAGEHGRGFAVVAEEVRRLAERSAQSAQEIAGLIERIQESTAEAVTAMEQGAAEVEQGDQLTGEAGQALRAITATVSGSAAQVAEIVTITEKVQRSIQTLAEAFSSIAKSSEENAAAAKQMEESAAVVANQTAGIADIAHENAAAAQEVSASVEQLTAASEEVAASAKSLGEIAVTLNETVQGFRLS